MFKVLHVSEGAPTLFWKSFWAFTASCRVSTVFLNLTFLSGVKIFGSSAGKLSMFTFPASIEPPVIFPRLGDNSPKFPTVILSAVIDWALMLSAVKLVTLIKLASKV